MTELNERNISRELTGASFAALRHSEITAIVLDDIVPPADCHAAASKLRILTQNSSYAWSNDLTILGVSVGEAHEGPEALDRYLAGAPGTVELMRNVVFDGVTPIDRITQRMLAIWEPGIRIPFRDGRPFLGQVLRRWKTGGGALPHLDQSNTLLLQSLGFHTRFGVNVYLEMPESGGAIEFWNRRVSDEEYAKIRRPAPGYGIDRDVLGPSDLAMRPRQGQAVIFDASKPHAVEAVGTCGGERVTNASFFGFGGKNAPLQQFA